MKGTHCHVGGELGTAIFDVDVGVVGDAHHRLFVNGTAVVLASVPNRLAAPVVGLELILAVAAVFACLITFAATIRVPLDGMADPSDATYVPRPEWYFLSLFQLLKYFPGRLEPVATMVIPGAVVTLLALLPFLDRRPERHPGKRRLVMAACGALAVGARRVSDGMFMAAAKALASSSPARDNPKHNLLPPVSALREVAATVALAVALQAQKEGLVSNVSTDQVEQLIRDKVWTPRYVPYLRAAGAAP